MQNKNAILSCQKFEVAYIKVTVLIKLIFKSYWCSVKCSCKNSNARPTHVVNLLQPTSMQRIRNCQFQCCHKLYCCKTAAAVSCSFAGSIKLICLKSRSNLMTSIKPQLQDKLSYRGAGIGQRKVNSNRHWCLTSFCWIWMRCPLLLVIAQLIKNVRV